MKFKRFIVAILLAFMAENLPAQTLTTLVNFNGTNYIPANFQNSPLVQASDGNFYGTAFIGETLFKVTPAGTLTTLVSFTNALPLGGLLQGTDGYLYGTTLNGGNPGAGTIFKTTLGGTLTTLASFDGVNNGIGPTSLTAGNDGNFYGTTLYGSYYGFAGTIFKMTFDGNANLTTLISFNGTNGNISHQPPILPRLIQGTDGCLYGTAYGGGNFGAGTVFKATFGGTLTTLISFNVTNGAGPSGGLVQGPDENFYGTTQGGGVGGKGTVFRITTNGLLTTLVSFQGTNGDSSPGGLVLGKDGNFYGVTSFGGAYIDQPGFGGTIFKITSDGTLTTLYSFNATNGYPSTELVQGTDGNFYGMTFSQNNGFNGGTIFRFSLQNSAFIVTQPTSQSVPVGSIATFNVVADGQPTLVYQWQFNGNPIAGATNSSLSLTNVQISNAGNYSVTVRNSYGSVASAAAALKLVTVDISIPCYLMTVTPLPDRQSGKNNLIIVTHGWELEGTSADISWITNLCNSISNQLAIRGSNDWQVVPYSWLSQAGLPPWYSFTGNNIVGDIGSLQFANLAEPALENAENIGTQIGRQIASQGWSHVHLIAHSAGAGLIQKAAEAIRATSPSTVIQTTFLDPFLGTDYRGLQLYGTDADWADDYFTYDQLTGSYTQGALPHAFNVDVTWVDPAASVTTAYVSGNTENFNQLSPQIIGYTALSSHEWPHDFYQETVLGTVKNCTAGFGFPLSMEVGGGNNLLIYPEGNSPQEPCGTTPISQNPFVANTGSQLQIGVLPNSMSSLGATLSGNSGLNLSSTSLQITPLGKFKPLDANSTSSTNSPAWFAVGLTITNFVNFVQFDSAFTDSNNAEGLLTVYWDTNQIGTVDERVVSPGLQTYRFYLPNTVTNNVYVLGFRLDSFDNTSSSIMVTNVATGFIGITTPLTLGLTLTNNTPILQLTGASNYNYLVQTSTNLVDWTPTALLVNSNGIVLFPDSTATNSGTRFYRALMP